MSVRFDLTAITPQLMDAVTTECVLAEKKSDAPAMPAMPGGGMGGMM